MTKTLADMTAEERAECVGMWAVVEDVQFAVIAEADDMGTCVVVYPERDGTSAVHLNEMVTPRHDLRPAWAPGGKPFLRPAWTPKRSRDRNPINASEVQGILGTDWLDGKTPEELVRERREGKQ